MSDIKTGIDRIKQLLQEAEGIDLSNAHLASMTATRAYHQLKSESLQIIPYLITNIESQQKDINRLDHWMKHYKNQSEHHEREAMTYQGELAESVVQVESQKEEIDRLYDALLSIVDGNWSCLFHENGLEVWSTDRINPSGIAFQAISYKQEGNK